ncbi:flavodoxin family protein [Enterovibrio norvegicus]|uniref:flavodoxin family protein n=1 Tax=Enterovibrio norvegicus TaxID=188144 RepID=UPI0013D6051F|nr:flavodoxin family protein [Enterovibrio norvegicus]
MKRIAIVYFSQTGSTKSMAQAIAQGAQQLDAEVKLYPIVGTDIIEGRFKNEAVFDELANMDAIIFGSPTYMGGPAAQFKAFADASSESWSNQLWHNKLAAGFTTGGSPCGEVQSTIESFYILATQHSMLWVGVDAPEGTASKTFNRLNSSLGAIGMVDEKGQLDDIDIKTAKRLGERVASLIH